MSLLKHALRFFGWQDGYGAFSVSKSNVPSVVKYIQDQREHHKTQTFQEEYLEFLKKHGVEYDERYLWG
jgi:putative transposase